MCFFCQQKRSLGRGLSQRIKKKKTGAEAKRFSSIMKPENQVSNHKKGIWGPELVPRSIRRTEERGDFAMTSWDFTHYCG